MRFHYFQYSDLNLTRPGLFPRLNRSSPIASSQVEEPAQLRIIWPSRQCSPELAYPLYIFFPAGRWKDQLLVDLVRSGWCSSALIAHLRIRLARREYP